VPAESRFTRVTPSEEMVGAAMELVGALAMPSFESTTHNNPMLQKFYAHLQAYAFADETPQWSAEDDSLVPDQTIVSSAPVVAASTKLAELCDGADVQAKAKAKKRANCGEGGGTAKRPKKAPVDASAIDWKLLASSDTLKKQTVATLKAGCFLMKLPVSGKKGDLVARIADHLAAQPRGPAR
jgi:hypothetical protein